MVVPTSIESQFRRLDKHLKELKNIDAGETSEDVAIIVADICNSCVLTLDKAMNAVWKEKSIQKKGKDKANIYFPRNMDSREKLAERLKKDQMPNIEKDDPKIFELIYSVQVQKDVNWLSLLYKIAAIRHENYPKISKVKSEGLAIGKGQDLFVESMIVDGSGNIKFKGHGINRESGKIEAARFDFIKELRSVLEGVDEDPYEFCSVSVAKVKRLVSKLYSYLPKD
jgi:hypothetical protein